MVATTKAEHVKGRTGRFVSFSVAVGVTLGGGSRLGIGKVFKGFQTEFIFGNTICESFSMEVDSDVLEENLFD